ncbi:hypothetical protein EDC19_2603 [Natranaerovirga hydrolytica]|uniref:Polymerase/histidinol phosphatase N-terminal domain-containing protein n=1 Tax=Natranaerovirga hydrolytica TaxID=680378 RepID=A0A4R1M6R2_9FIRM|nr:PHP domain-containing protein [Natranaerovirga hydrolytica]TCK87956.1 hypothetical protein EDC19_2603 [Natranaerovirga hydrolytica]
MLLKYDLHIHTGLSPCAHKDMTPNNIVRMAHLNQLDTIAITDHNSTKNIEVVMDVAKDYGIKVIPGIEIESKEEIHSLVYFSTLNDVYNMQRIIDNNMKSIKNNAKLFGQQNIYNNKDEVIGIEKKLLLSSINLTINQIYQYTIKLKGAMVFAHIDRPSNSIISNLGMMPHNIKTKTIEVSRYATMDQYKKMYSDYHIIQSSDAHELGYIGICEKFIQIDDNTTAKLVDKLRG